MSSFCQHASDEPERPAFVVGSRLTTYGEIRNRIAQTATRLSEHGVKRRDRVLLVGVNHDDLAVAYLAVHSIGAIAVPVDPTLPKDEMEFVVNDASPSIALVDAHQQTSIRTEDLSGFTQWAGEPPDWEPLVTLEDDADILYTTGTTGRKKGVLLTQNNIAAAAVNIASFIGNSKSDLEVVPVPLSHSFGLGRLRSMALVGNTLVLEPGMKNPAALLKRVLELEANGVALVPAGFELILGLTRDKLSEARCHLRYIEIGSAPLRRETRERLMALLPDTRICHHYGLTEASRACFCEFHSDRHKPLSVGRPAPNVAVSVIDKSGQPVAPGHSGEIVVQGSMTMKEYWNRPDLNSHTCGNGGFKTDDIGYVDEDGYVFLQGRRSDIINVGGLKVSPPEVESLVQTHDEVLDCACVGVPDRTTGETVKLFYVSKHDLDSRQVVNWLRQKLEEYKIPRAFERIQKIPRTPSGKIQRHLLRPEE